MKTLTGLEFVKKYPSSKITPAMFHIDTDRGDTFFVVNERTWLSQIGYSFACEGLISELELKYTDNDHISCSFIWHNPLMGTPKGAREIANSNGELDDVVKVSIDNCLIYCPEDPSAFSVSELEAFYPILTRVDYSTIEEIEGTYATFELCIPFTNDNGEIIGHENYKFIVESYGQHHEQTAIKLNCHSFWCDCIDAADPFDLPRANNPYKDIPKKYMLKRFVDCDGISKLCIRNTDPGFVTVSFMLDDEWFVIDHISSDLVEVKTDILHLYLKCGYMKFNVLSTHENSEEIEII